MAVYKKCICIDKQIEVFPISNSQKSIRKKLITIEFMQQPIQLLPLFQNLAVINNILHSELMHVYIVSLCTDHNLRACDLHEYYKL